MAAFASAREMLEAYAKTGEKNGRFRVGGNMLMTPVFDGGGNLNRADRQIRVTVEEPAGKYVLFSREEHGKKKLYYLTASGRIDGTSTYIPDVYDGDKRDYVNARPTEAQLDEALTMALQVFERDMSNPRAWVKYQDAAALDRLDECDAHNAPVRILREEESERRREEAARQIGEIERNAQIRYDARVDEIAKAIEKGETLRVAYDAPEYGGKSPVLDLFKLYGVALPLRTQGWVKTGLAEITDGGYRYFKSRHKRDSSSFMGGYQELRQAIRLMPIEKKRAALAPPTPEAEAGDAGIGGETLRKEEDATMEHALYRHFTESFPRFMSGEFRALRLEAPDAKPLELEWVFGDRISIAHTYELNGQKAFEPRVEMLVYDKAEKLEALSLEITEPPRSDHVYYKGIPDTGRQKNIHDLLSAWLDRADKQHFVPVAATIDRDGEDIAVAFDAEGNILFPADEEEYNLTYWYGGSGITVLNHLDAQHEDHDELARINPDRSVEYYMDVPEEVRVRIETYAQTAEIPDRKPYVRHEEKEYDLGYGFPGNGITVWNRAEERDGDYVTVAHIDTDRGVTFYDADMPHDVREKIDAVAKSGGTRAFGFSPAPENIPPHIDGADAPASVYETVKRILPEAPRTPDMSLPDPAVTAAAMFDYGYTQEDMYPLSPEKAAELFDAGLTIYLLNHDNTEAIAFDRDEIIAIGNGGLCGITHADWVASPVYAAQMAVAANAEASRESELLYGDGNRFGIYQIKGGQDMREYIAEASARYEDSGIAVSRGNYELVYTAPLTEHIEYLSHRYQALFKIYQEFNTNKPADYTARPISNSDVIVLKYGGDVASFYVDGKGFHEIDGFLGDETQWAAAIQSERERGVIPFPAQAQNPSLVQTFSQVGKRLREKSPQQTETKPSLLGKLEQNKRKAARAGENDAANPKEREEI